MKNVGMLLEAQRQAEREFVAEAEMETGAPKGKWSAALTMFHLARWRGRLLQAMSELASGREFDPPTGKIDELNDAELSTGVGLSLADAAAESDTAFGGLIDLWSKLGDWPFKWYMATTTAEALVRNSYSHPRIHLAGYHLDRGDTRRAQAIFEETAAELRRADATQHILGAALCNLAGARVAQGRLDDALDLLDEALPMRTDLAAPVSTDSAFEKLRDSPRFQTLVARYSA
jgi:tetratricopeptide (TPR) repeat protein